MPKNFKHNVKIYYEDTDSGGVVYYANYLKYFERARSEAIYNLGFSNKKLRDQFGIIIIVKSCNIEYLKPAMIEDNLLIISKIITLSKTSFIMLQEAKRKKELIASAQIRLVAVNKNIKPTKIPEKLIKLLNKSIK